ncbi:ComF family protein [Candidatus Uhrbacteria bacterium]|nr:ComF family protein [Candidatus Uhrbacteria bacterium]
MLGRLAAGAGRVGSSIVSWCADVLAPRVCLSCGVEGAWWCVSCVAQLPVSGSFVCGRCERPSPAGRTCATCARDFPLQHVISIAPYAVASVQQMVQMVKYMPAHDVAQAYAILVAEFCARPANAALRAAVGHDLILIPIPLHWSRELERGFNQSAPIAAALADAGWGTVHDEVLVRVRRSAPQAMLTRAARLENMTDVFTVQRPDAVRGRAVLLVDDVCTTGATMSSAARTLRRAGAGTISGFAIARG